MMPTEYLLTATILSVAVILSYIDVIIAMGFTK